MSEREPEPITVDKIVRLHAAQFMSVASKIHDMILDPVHLNNESRDSKIEFERLISHFRDGFAAKNCKATAERLIEKIVKGEC